MQKCHVTIPNHLMIILKRYHRYFLKNCEPRTFNQTISVLVKYAIGDTKRIPVNEIIIIEEFFYRNEYFFPKFLQCVLLSFQTYNEKNFRK